MFWVNVSLALVLLTVLVVVAPFVATRFYGHAIIGWMLIVDGRE